jgi:hypothetical protein
MVFNVLGLISAGMKANMKLGTLSKVANVSLHVYARVSNLLGNLRTDVERPQNCGRRRAAKREDKNPWIRKSQHRSPEFQPGPNGKSSLKT